jgi:2-polyprenyl-6-methoxyphenol hydroxylase-like FAD-dependent oxidoreductase
LFDISIHLSTPCAGPNPNAMKILILGGGICGLSTYLALKQRLPAATITLYESHTSTTLGIGGGLGLAPNGLRALHSLDPKIPESIAARGFGCDRILFRNAAGRKLGTMISGTKERYGFEQQFLARSEVYAAVLERVEDKSGIVWGRKVKAVKEDGKRVVVTFEDGITEEADLVLGCDGVRSVTRQAVVDGAEAEYQYVFEICSRVKLIGHLGDLLGLGGSCLQRRYHRSCRMPLRRKL